MGMSYSVYVGPYFETARNVAFSFDKWEHVIADGRGELGVDEPNRYFVPNVSVPGISREMRYGRSDCDSVHAFTARQLSDELLCFYRLLDGSGFIEATKGTDVVVSLEWGIVVCCR